MRLSWQRNLGNIDRTLRVIIGLVLLYLAAFRPIALSGSITVLLWVAGAFMLIEGILAY